MYPREAALASLRTSGLPLRLVAARLGINVATLELWRRKARLHQGQALPARRSLKTYSLERRRQIVAAYRASGLSLARFAGSYDVSVRGLRSWLRAERESDAQNDHLRP